MHHPSCCTPHARPCPGPPPPCQQIGNPADLDAIFVAVGGGGLIAGIAAYVKMLQPHVKVTRTPVHGSADVVLFASRCC